MKNTNSIVLDTNILISYLLAPKSIPAMAVKKALHENEIVVSDETLNEIADVLSRKKFDKYISAQDRQEFFRKLAIIARNIPIINKIKACRDAKDDKFLELAVNANAKIIITGDSDLLELNPFQGIQIIKPAQYIKI